MTPGDEFAPITLVKHVLPALVAVVFTLTACKTTADRFDLYAPDKPQGPYLERLRGMTLAGRYNHKSSTMTVPVSPSATVPGAPADSGPIAPPPPPPPGTPEMETPDTGVGAPAPTPFPEAAPAAPASNVVIPSTTVPGAPPTTSEPAIPGLSPPAAPAPAEAASPAPAIPGLSQ